MSMLLLAKGEVLYGCGERDMIMLLLSMRMLYYRVRGEGI